jgi:phosphoglucomutase
MAIAYADIENISLILANDPDADRFNAAEHTKGKWHIFTGNELGIILAHHVYTRHTSPPSTTPLAMLSSAVSSKMLASMARKEGFHHEETLTGFKWLGNQSLKLVAEGYDVPYAFEEAIGYMFSEIVRDKDGIAAATVFLSLVREIYAGGGTVLGHLEGLYQRYFSGMTDVGMDILRRGIRMLLLRTQIV